jgi:aspartyl-tRNA(Asn)/glutamyl-tRNA(Gln) amidotransferase subunit A
VSGLPSISVPGGFTSAGLPIGLQIAGKPFDESTVLRVAFAYQQAVRWFEQRPPI